MPTLHGPTIAEGKSGLQSQHTLGQVVRRFSRQAININATIFLTVFRTRANRLLIPWRQRRHLGRSELCKQHYAKQNTSVYVTITDYNHPHAWNLVSQGKPSAGELASWLQGANQYHGFSWFSLHNWPESVAPKCVRILNHDQFLVNQQLMCRNSGLKTAAPAIQ